MTFFTLKGCYWNKTLRNDFLMVSFWTIGIILKHNSWATTYEKRSKLYKLNTWRYQFAFIKANFLWLVFLQTPSNASNHHPKAILLWENIVPQSCTKCAIYKQWLLDFQLQPYVTPFIILFGHHGNHSNHTFDQLGTICNDYLVEYRITGA